MPPTHPRPHDARSGTSGWYATTAKRWIDVLLAALGLVLAAPLLALVAIFVLFTLGRPVLFQQARPGRHGAPFTLYKFRSMRVPTSDDSDGDAHRLTAAGRLLRATSLDELPELWNVLRGDMSLVGPRPLLTEYLPLYSADQARRHEARPGLTGWSQVEGRNATDWGERLRQDVWYVDNVSLRLDVWILLRTVATVLGQRGVSAEGHATMPPFTGEGNSSPNPKGNHTTQAA